MQHWGIVLAIKVIWGPFANTKQQYIFFFSKELPNAPPVTAKCRYNMAVLAFGDKVQPLSFYNSLNAQDGIEENNTEIIDVNYTNNMIKVVIDEKQPELITNNVLKPVQQDFQSVVDLMVHKNDEFGSKNESLNIFLKKLGNVKTKNSWDTFLSTCGKQISLRHANKAKIRVQPTSISRRRPGVTRDSSRLVVGRPAKTENSKKNKRKRNLQQNINKNQPNAKSH
ncbi:unnamed protein product [Macrosiphum euphorbiae]|uniref:Uncharacterized protein n=1 Tax=Macrosiphum euphorbiae TaxID=13131 RepID=A0AAV0WR58_9HEMI|nr:unnamed protein product [Macrosiphum euphorbiae]